MPATWTSQQGSTVAHPHFTARRHLRGLADVTKPERAVHLPRGPQTPSGGFGRQAPPPPPAPKPELCPNSRLHLLTSRSTPQEVLRASCSHTRKPEGLHVKPLAQSHGWCVVGTPTDRGACALVNSHMRSPRLL